MSARISSVTTTISETDLMENIREFVDVEGLTINDLQFKDKGIEVTGNFHKVIDIPFFARVKVVGVIENKIHIVVEKIKVLKMGIPGWIISTAVKGVQGKLSEQGVTYEDGQIVIDVDKSLQKVDFVHLIIDNIIMENGILAVKVSSISADVKAMQAENEKKKEYEESGQKAIDEKNAAEAIAQKEYNYNMNISKIASESTEDEYSKIRRDLYKRVPTDFKDYYKYAAAIPDIFALAVRVMMDKRVLKKDKLIIGLSMGYFLSPIDIIPDKFPLLGAIDDIALFVFGVNHLVNSLPLPIVVEHWAGDLKVLKFIKDNISSVMGPTGSANVQKIYGLVEDKLTEKFGGYQPDEAYFKA